MKIIDPSGFVPIWLPTDWDRLNWGLQQAAKYPGCLLDLSGRRWSIDQPLSVMPSGTDRLTFDIVGNGFATISYSGTAPALTIGNWKESRMTNLGIRAAYSLLFVSNNSSGLNVMERCQCEGEVRWDDLGTGKDVSNWDVVLCRASTFRVVGSNALGPWQFRMCSSIDSPGWAFDLSRGGCGASFLDCGATRAKEGVFKLAGGFQYNIAGGRSEECGSLLTMGGNDADGEGQTNPLTIVNRIDDAIADVYMTLKKAGIVRLQSCSRTGSNLVVVKNENQQAPLNIYCEPGLEFKDIGTGAYKAISALMV